MMAIPLPPAPLDARFDADGFRCVVRTREVLLGPAVLTHVAIVAFALLVSLAATVGAWLAVHWVLVACVSALWVGAGQFLLDLLLDAPRSTHLACTHDALAVEVRVLGIRCRRVVLPLGRILGCHASDRGLEVVHGDGLARRRLAVVAPLDPHDARRLAEEIDRAAARRRRFERDEAARAAARVDLELLLERPRRGLLLTRRGGTGSAGPPAGSR